MSDFSAAKDWARVRDIHGFKLTGKAEDRREGGFGVIIISIIIIVIVVRIRISGIRIRIIIVVFIIM